MAGQVRQLGEEHIDAVVDVLFESFYGYPVMRYVVGDGDYDWSLRELLTFFAMARVVREEPVLGIGDSLDGVALCSDPGVVVTPRRLGEIRDRVWAQLGPEAEARYEAFGSACAQFRIVERHVHLNMVGVRTTAQGRGVGRRLIEYVQEMSVQDPESVGVTLSTEDERNVPLYEYLGYEVIGHARVAPELQTWSFFRRDADG
jgi:ribosomal protein S18 acetylase RimI-like enzyme